MFNKQVKDLRSRTEAELVRVDARLKELSVDSAEYKELQKMRKEIIVDLQKLHKDKVSPDTIISVLGHLAGIVLVLKFETIGILTTKALSVAPKIFKGRV